MYFVINAFSLDCNKGYDSNDKDKTQMQSLFYTTLHAQWVCNGTKIQKFHLITRDPLSDTWQRLYGLGLIGIGICKCKFNWCSWAKVSPDSKVHGANMGPTWVLSAPVGPHVGPMNLAIKVSFPIIWTNESLVCESIYTSASPSQSIHWPLGQDRDSPRDTFLNGKIGILRDCMLHTTVI